MGQPLVDGAFQFVRAVESSAADHSSRGQCKEPFHLVQPRTAGGGEVEVKSPGASSASSSAAPRHCCGCSCCICSLNSLSHFWGSLPAPPDAHAPALRRRAGFFKSFEEVLATTALWNLLSSQGSLPNGRKQDRELIQVVMPLSLFRLDFRSLRDIEACRGEWR